MAKAKAAPGRQLSEIGQVIVAAWYKVLPDTGNTPTGTIATALDGLRPELNAVIAEILRADFRNKFTIIFDGDVEPNDSTPAGKINIVVPFPPARNRTDLIRYLMEFHTGREDRHFHEELGVALLFGCGR